MQQYFTIKNGPRTLTVFHTNENVSFDVEHYGNFKIGDKELLSFLQSDQNHHVVYHNEAEEHPKLAELRPNIYKDEDEQVAELEKQPDGSLHIDIQTGRGVTLTLTPEQTETLQDSIAIGEVERYNNGKYPIESVSRDGILDRV